MAKDHGTELTTRASIGAKDLLSLLHRSLEQPVSLARRRFLAFCRSLAQSVKPAVQERGVCRQVPLDFFADLIANMCTARLRPPRALLRPEHPRPKAIPNCALRGSLRWAMRR